MAISVLHATPTQLGILTAAAGAPWLLIAPLLAVGIDRIRRRPLLIATDMGRGLLLGLIPLTAWHGVLQIELLYLVAFVHGLLTACFETAYQAYLPTLVAHEQLLDGNTKLNISSSAADVAGPGLAGLVIQLLSAPWALLIDAASFLLSALSLKLIETREPRSARLQPTRFWQALRDGWSYLWHHPILRAFTVTNAHFMLCFGIIQAVLFLFLTHTLDLRESVIGFIFGLGGGGGLLGAAMTGRLSQRYGVGPTIIGASAGRGLGLALLPLALLLPPMGAIWCLALLYTLHQSAWSIWAVTQASVRQSLVPHQLQGRVTAGFLFVVRSAMPLGALLGGWLGQALGIVPTMVGAGIGLVLATVWLCIPALRLLRVPPPAEV